MQDADADRQQRTAAEILRRFVDQPGVVLADEVGMGKTFVALAVAVSVVEATRRKRPVVVLVPRAVAEKWPKEWAVFADRCLPSGHNLRAVGPIWRGSEFLRLLDDPASRRKHIIFMSHGALTSSLQDPFVGLAILRQATARRPELLARRRHIARHARSLLNDRRFQNADLVFKLLESPPARWAELWNHRWPKARLDDDPVPFSFLEAAGRVDLDPVRAAVLSVPINRSASMDSRLRSARKALATAINLAWTDALCCLNVRLPLLVLDEAHHVRNDTRLGRLFANEEAERDAEALQGALGNMFERMLFLTATPFQLGHAELLRVLHRFEGVRWRSAPARAEFGERIDALTRSLDQAQASTLRLERAWSRLQPEHQPAVEALSDVSPAENQPEALRVALGVAQETKAGLAEVEALLKPWVIRHLKPDKAVRRRYLPGAGILDGGDTSLGLSVGGGATLPFLLAARAQAVSSLEGGQSATRSYFAYGLASSFEAYRDTRRNRMATLDDQLDAAPVPVDVTRRLRWYLDRIASALPDDGVEGWADHPKVDATVNRVLDLWRTGEKSLIFCFYVETGKALRAHISRALRSEIVTSGAQLLDLDAADPERVLEGLGQTSDRLLRSDAPGYDAFRKRIISFVGGLDPTTGERLAEVVIRFMRTPSFLVRFVDLSSRADVASLVDALERSDGSGLTLGQRIEAFADHVGRLVNDERDALFSALEGIQTGAIGTRVEEFDPSERARSRESLLPNVRLANGGGPRRDEAALDGHLQHAVLPGSPGRELGDGRRCRPAPRLSPRDPP